MLLYGLVILITMWVIKSLEHNDGNKAKIFVLQPKNTKIK